MICPACGDNGIGFIAPKEVAMRKVNFVFIVCLNCGWLQKYAKEPQKCPE